VEVDIKEYTHFTYNASKSVVSGNINGDGGQVLSVYYTRDSYKIVANYKKYTIISPILAINIHQRSSPII
jgi:hypothetical protein